jgi:hypothetical protein
MQDSLGGNAKTLMFVNCSPSIYNEMETKNSLEYAKRVKEIKNNPTLNMETKAMQLAQKQLEAQQAVIDSLKGLANDNGLGAKLQDILAQMEKTDEAHEGGSALALDLSSVIGKEDENQIKDKPASGRSSNELANIVRPQSARSFVGPSRPSLKASASGPIKQLKK